MDTVRRLGLGAMAAALLAAGAVPARGEEKVADLDRDLYLLKAVVAGNVTAWPVGSRTPADKVGSDFVTLAEAQEKGLAVVKEVGTGAPQARARPANAAGGPSSMAQQEAIDPGERSGVVNELVIENKGSRPLLVLAGTLVKGGKQDRQIGEDFIVPAGRTVPVAAFCVEHGRWTATREGSDTGGVFKAQKALSTRSVRENAQFKGDQSGVWAEVAKQNAAAGVDPGTGTLMATMETADGQALARRERVVRALSERFAALAAADPAPVGIAYAIDGKVREVRVFSHPALFQRMVETLINTIAVEADLAARQAAAAKRPAWDKAADPAGAIALVSEAGRAKADTVTTKAGNRLEKRKAGSALNSDCFDEGAARPVTRTFMKAE